MAALTDPRSDEQAYRDHERSVLAMLSTRYRDLDPDSRRELYHEAWASVLKRRREGLEIESLRAYLIGAADKLAAKRVYGADARRRQTFDPGAPGYAGLADTAEQPDETVLAADEARRVHMLIDELDEAERALLKLRLDLGLDPPEIRERLGLTDRQYRRTAERARKSLLAQFRAFDRGEWARGKRSLLCACVMGIASDTQRARAQRLIDEDPCCRAMMSELRELGGNAAAILPLPATTVAVGTGHDGIVARAAELFGDVKTSVAELAARAGEGGGAKDRSLGTLSNVKRQAGETLMGAKQHANNIYVRSRIRLRSPVPARAPLPRSWSAASLRAAAPTAWPRASPRASGCRSASIRPSPTPSQLPSRPMPLQPTTRHRHRRHRFCQPTRRPRNSPPSLRRRWTPPPPPSPPHHPRPSPRTNSSPCLRRRRPRPRPPRQPRARPARRRPPRKGEESSRHEPSRDRSESRKGLR